LGKQGDNCEQRKTLAHGVSPLGWGKRCYASDEHKLTAIHYLIAGLALAYKAFSGGISDGRAGAFALPGWRFGAVEHAQTAG
jgi:hypothetical protein